MVQPRPARVGPARGVPEPRASASSSARPYGRSTRRSGLLRLRTPYGRVVAGKVALGTGGFPAPLRRLRHYIAPVYDYALVTEPLSDAQLASIGWRNRQGVGDGGNQFHYYRLTADNRILWGGYDAIYHYGGAVRAELERRPETFATLAEHFFTTFPQLVGRAVQHTPGAA